MNSDSYVGRLPRMSRLRMFESAARHLSFTKSAAELGVTQAAVSQQVRALEVELGVNLFERHHRGLALTPEARRLLRSVVSAFDQIADTAGEIRAASRPATISVGVTFSIGTFWLLRRLPQFRSSFPDIAVDIVATDDGFERIADQVEIGLAYGDGTWSGFDATLLRRSDVFPVCSPAYKRSRPNLVRPEELLQDVLLSNEDARHGRFGWQQWFAALDIGAGSLQPGIRFNSHHLVMQAACEGQGIALGWSLLTDDLIAQGQLVKAVDATVPSQKGFFLVAQRERQNAANLLFADWIRAQFA